MRLLLILAGTLLAAGPAPAHEGVGANGGRVTGAGRYHVELVVRGGTVDVYVLDGGEKPVPAAGFTGAAILVVDGRPARIVLAPVEGNRMSGTAGTALPARPKGAVRLTAPDGTSASVAFE